MSKEQIRNIPKNTSSDIVWISWYEIIKKNFGKKKANALFTANWDSQNGFSSNANTSKLRRHLKENGGIEISGSALSEVKDKLLDAGNFFGDYFIAGKYLGIALGVIVVGGIGMIVFNLAKRPQAVIRAGTAIATRGISEGMLKN